jgi:lipopolysaccharide biosynthesis regulator YciM
MYSKIILLVLLIIVGAFFYLHTINPGEATFVITKEWTFVQPVTVFILVGFFAGVAVAAFNTLYADAVRAIKDLRARREKRFLELAESNYRDGSEELLRGNPRKARQLLKKALGANPRDIDILLRLAESNMDQDMGEDAMKVLEGGLLKNPGNMELLYAVGRYYLATGERTKAEKTFIEILDKYPTNPFALRGLRDIRIEEGDWEEASELQRTLLGRRDDGGDVAGEKELLTGLLYETARKLMEEGDPDAALVTAKEALKNDNAFIPAHLLLGEVHYSTGNSHDAVKVWEKAYDKYRDAAIFLRLEDMYLEESDPQKILDRYSKAISTSPGDRNLRLLLSRLYLRLEMVDNAIEELERIGSEGEEGFYHRVLLGEAYSRREPGSKAATLFKRALGLDKELPPPFRCSSCNETVLEWSERCRGCKSWNTFTMSTDYSPATQSPPPRPPAPVRGEGPPQ